MNVTVMSRRNAVLYCGQKNSDKSVMISISDPRMVYDDEPFVSEENGILEVLVAKRGPSTTFSAGI